ncbi:MAG: prenyltransferase [Deltaproteobacteria bacterium]|nr:prenyltransferase [Deltaproteobacteria bacterium]
MNIKGIVTIIRVPFLILALILGVLGTGVAWYEARRFGAPFQGGYAVLATLGLLICHAAVNIFNEYFDCKSGLDYRTRRTPFSGGSGAVPSGLLTVRQALGVGIVCFALVIPIGIFFTVVKGWLLVPLLVLAALLIILYTPVILKMGYPEWSPGLGLGILPVLGAYFVHAGTYSASALIASLPSYFLVHNLLLLNEFPDVEADLTVRRRTLPIVLGKKGAACVFSFFTLAAYLWIAGAVAAAWMPVWTLLSFLTLPLALQVIRGAFRYDDWEAFLPVLGKNVQLVLLTQALIAVGYILGGLFTK